MTPAPPPADRDQKDTRQRLLDAARLEFAEHGFRGATVRAIAERADANLNAINYHFRSKVDLYGAVLAEIAGRVPDGSPPPRLADAPDDPEGQLARFVKWNAMRFLGPASSPLHGLMLHEVRDPTPILDRIIETAMRPLDEILRELVTACLPEGAPESSIRRLCLSVLGQTNIYKFGWPMVSRLYPELELDKAEVEGIAAGIARTTLAGLHAERERLANGGAR